MNIRDMMGSLVIVSAAETPKAESAPIGGIDEGVVLILAAISIGLALVCSILLIVFIVKLNGLRRRLNHFLMGQDAESLEDEIRELIEDAKYLKETADKNKKDIRTIYRRLEKVYQKCGLVKYDAFNQMGGQLSFCLAMLDEKNNGFILNSVHSTEGCYSYTKEIKAGECALDLGKEEAEALSNAMEA